jgi:hypothetical protein
MSEETQQEGTWSSLKKTIVGTLATVVTAGGAWLGSTLFGGGSENAQPAPAQPNIIINNTQQQQQQAASGGGKTVVIKEKETVKEAAPKPKKKEGDEFKEEAPKW